MTRYRPKENRYLPRSVNYAEAHRVRLRLLSEKAPTLSKRDRQTLLKILNEVYPIRRNSRSSNWSMLLIGMVVGISLVVLFVLSQ